MADLVEHLARRLLLGLGIIAALNQIGVATTVTTPTPITVLAIIAGVLIVGVGGGAIKPMQQRWQNWLNAAELEAGNLSAGPTSRAGYPSSTGTARSGTVAAQHTYPATQRTVPIDPNTGSTRAY